MNNNNISSISPVAFYGLTIIEILDLEGNALQEFPDFKNISNSTKHINISKNLIREIKSEYLDLPALYTLRLDNNELTDFNISYPMEKLEYLDLENNKLTRPPECIYALPSIKTLDVKYNRINGTINCKYLNKIIMLEYLMLTSNNIEYAEFCEMINLHSNELTTPPKLNYILPQL